MTSGLGYINNQTPAISSGENFVGVGKESRDKDKRMSVITNTATNFDRFNMYVNNVNPS